MFAKARQASVRLYSWKVTNVKRLSPGEPLPFSLRDTPTRLVSNHRCHRGKRLLSALPTPRPLAPNPRQFIFLLYSPLSALARHRTQSFRLIAHTIQNANTIIFFSDHGRSDVRMDARRCRRSKRLCPQKEIWTYKYSFVRISQYSSKMLKHIRLFP